MSKRDEILKYLDGEMSPDQRSEFEDRLKSDSEMKKMYDLLKLIYKTIDIDNEKDLSEKVNNAYEKHIRIRRLKVYLYTVSAAAVVALLVVFYFSYFNQAVSTQELFSQNYQPYKIENTIRGKISEKGQFEKAIEQYESGDYKDALNTLSSLSGDSTDQRIVSFISGQIYLATGDCKEAITSFNICLADSKCSLSEHAQWYLALSYLKCDQIENAKKEFNIVIESSEYYREKSEAILSSLPE